jgi:hypothetical protein
LSKLISLKKMGYRNRLAANDLHVCAGCGTEATNCKPITNLKEKIELSNLH